MHPGQECFWFPLKMSSRDVRHVCLQLGCWATMVIAVSLFVFVASSFGSHIALVTLLTWLSRKFHLACIYIWGCTVQLFPAY